MVLIFRAWAGVVTAAAFHVPVLRSNRPAPAGTVSVAGRKRSGFLKKANAGLDQPIVEPTPRRENRDVSANFRF
jgi:hypothetical protein